MGDIVLAGATSGTTTLTPAAVSGTTTLTLPATTDTLVGKTTTDTLTNKTLTSPTITGASITVASTAAPAFSAYTTTTQALTGAVTTKVNFGGEVFDTNSNFASSRFTPTVAGYYQLTTALVYNAATFTDLYIYKNGSVYQQIFGNYSSSTYYGSGTGLIYLNGTTDYAEIYVYSSSSLSITSSQQNCWFSGAMVRSA
jgi:hypothetical protein